MTDDEILISHVRDLKKRCADNSMITNTAFLDLRQRSLLDVLKKEESAYVNTFYYGGYEGAERTAAIFVPVFLDCEDGIEEYFSKNASENPLLLIKITKDKFSSLSHRDYLGALMGLGLKREVTGDIISFENGAYVAVLSSVSAYICENLKSVGRATVTAFETSFDEISERTDNSEEKKAFVSSLRLDNILSACFSLSRSEAALSIQKGIVFVNSLQMSKPDFKVKENDKIVLRGKGKVVFVSVNGQSKKGRLHITFRKYI